MPEQNTPDAAESAAESTTQRAAAKKPATRSRASKAAAPAVEQEAAAETASKPVRKRPSRAKAATQAAPAEAAPAENNDEVVAPARKRAPRRTKAQIAADAAENAALEAIAAEPAPGAEATAEAPAAATATPARKRAPRRTKAQIAAEAAEAAAAAAAAEPAAEQAAEAAAKEAEAAPAAKATRTRAPRRTKAQIAAEAAATAAAEAAQEEPAVVVEEELEESEKPAEAALEPLSPFAIPTGLDLIFQAPDLDATRPARGGRASEDDEPEEGSRRRRRRRRGTEDMEIEGGTETDPPGTVTRVRAPRAAAAEKPVDHVVSIKGSTRLEAKRQRRRESRESGRRRHGISEAEFLARRESVDRKMVVRQQDARIQIGVLEDGVLAEHFVSHTTQDSMIGNVYVGKVQNVLPSMEAAFIDIGRGRNAVLYAGEVDWDAAELNGKPRRIEHALKSGDTVLVQVTKDPVGHKGARLTSQISLPGRYLVYVPGGSMTGISRKLPDVERNRLKKILKDHLPDKAGVIVRTAAEGAAEQELMNDINRLRYQWEGIQKAVTSTKTRAPELLYAEPDLTIKVVRDVFNEDFSQLIVQGEQAWDTIEAYVTYVAPDLLDRLQQWDGDEDVFVEMRIEEQIRKALERKVNLPSGGSLVIDRTEAMTVVDVNTGKFTGHGGNLEETVTKNNLEAAEEIVRQMRLRDMGGIIVVDFIDMVLESNRDLVLRRLVECLGRDRTKHQVAEVTSLGLVQMTRKKIGTGLLEVFSQPCEVCDGRGSVIHDEPVEGQNRPQQVHTPSDRPTRSERRRTRQGEEPSATEAQAQPEHKEPAAVAAPVVEQSPEERERAEKARAALAKVAAASAHGHEEHHEEHAVAAAEPEQSQSPADGGVEGEDDKPRRRRRRGRRGRGGRQDELLEGEQSEDDDASAESEPEAEPQQQAHDREHRVVVDREPQVSKVAQVPSVTAEAPVVVQAEVVTLVAGGAPRRRRRAASSAQGSTSTQAVQAAPAAGTRVSSASAQAPVAAPAAAEPIMLGVGVPASEL